jgi:hypothetical protein
MSMELNDIYTGEESPCCPGAQVTITGHCADCGENV